MKKFWAMMMTVALLLSCVPALALDVMEVETAARAYVPAGAVLKKVELDDGVYEVTFTVLEQHEKWEVMVSPTTGQVVALESEKRTVMGMPVTPGEALDAQKIEQAVLALYPDAQILRTDTLIDDGLYEIEVFFTAGGLYGTLELDAQTGDVLERKIVFGEYQEGGMLTEEAARAALLSIKPEAMITKIKLDEDDGAYYWEGDAYIGHTEYEFAINAMTGVLVEWERD